MTLEHAVTVEASVTSKNLSKVALLRVAQYPLIALFAIIVPRLMGPTLYGHYALFVSIVGMGTALLSRSHSICLQSRWGCSGFS
jgi:hypothetical protein